MPYKNIKDLLVDATKIPASLEAQLPNGIPKLSSTLLNMAASVPAIPDFPMAIPDIPALPTFAIPGLPALAPQVKEEVPPSPAPRRAPAFKFA